MSSEIEPSDIELGTGQKRDRSGYARPIWLLEHSQDVIAVTVGAVLILLAAVLLISGIWDFLTAAPSVSAGTTGLLDKALLVLILAEIVHTVVLALRAHRLVAQPFIVIGLVAVIRRILFLLSNQQPPSTTELATLIAMVVAFVAGLIAVSRYEKPAE